MTEQTSDPMTIAVDTSEDGKSLMVYVQQGAMCSTFGMTLTHAYEFVRVLDKGIRKLASNDETAKLFEELLRESGESGE